MDVCRRSRDRGTAARIIMRTAERSVTLRRRHRHETTVTSAGANCELPTTAKRGTPSIDVLRSPLSRDVQPVPHGRRIGRSSSPYLLLLECCALVGKLSETSFASYTQRKS